MLDSIDKVESGKVVKLNGVALHVVKVACCEKGNYCATC